MHWIIRNIDHLTVPLAMLLSLFSIVIGAKSVQRRKQGNNEAVLKGPYLIASICVICICLVLAGVALTKAFA